MATLSSYPTKTFITLLVPQWSVVCVTHPKHIQTWKALLTPDQTQLGIVLANYSVDNYEQVIESLVIRSSSPYENVFC